MTTRMNDHAHTDEKQLTDLLQTEAQWTKGVCARNAQEKECAIEDPAAVQWCLEGATRLLAHQGHRRRNAPPEPARSIGRALRQAINELYGTNSIALWNDEPTTTWPMVQNVLRRTEEILRAT